MKEKFILQRNVNSELFNNTVKIQAHTHIIFVYDTLTCPNTSTY